MTTTAGWASWAAFDFNENDALYLSEISPATDTPVPFPVQLHDRLFQLDLKLYAETTIDLLREARDDTAAPSEHSLSAAGAWKRSVVDWSLGAGQEWADEEDSNPARFYRSVGVDPWNRRILCPHMRTVAIDGTLATFARILPAGGYLYKLGSGGLQFSNDLTDATTTWSDVTGSSGTHVAVLTTDGNEVIFVDGTGMFHVAIGLAGAATAFGGAAATYKPVVLEWASGYLWAALSSNAVISTIAADGTKTDRFTHPITGFRWTDVCGTPKAVFAAGNTTDRGLIYRWVVDSDDGTLPTVGTLAVELPRGELVRCVEHYGGYLFIGTNKGFHVAQLTSGGLGGDVEVVLGPRVALGIDVLCAFGDDRFVWFGWTNYRGLGKSMLGRCDLSRFTAPNVAAYATDIQVPPNSTDSGAVSGVARIADRTFFCTNTPHVYRQRHDDLFEASASLELGKFTWTAYGLKAFLGADIYHEPLAGAFTLEVVNDEGTVVASGRTDLAGSTGASRDFVGAGSGPAEAYTVNLTFEAENIFGTDAPCLRRLSLWAVPMLRNITRYDLPLRLFSDQIVGPGDGQDHAIDTWETYEWLKELERSQRIVGMVIGRTGRSVVVQRVQIPQGAVRGWNDDYSWFEATAIVSVVSVEV